MSRPELNRGPWTCRWACIAGAVRSSSSVESSDVIWTCDLGGLSTATQLFLREACAACSHWEAAGGRQSVRPQWCVTQLLPDYARPSPVVARTRRYERGERIFEEGTTSDLFYTTTSGSVKFVKTSTQGNESIVGIASGICPLSPDGLDSGRTFRVTAVALEDTTCIQVPRRELVALFKEYPTVALRLYQELCERLDASFTWIADLSRGTVEVRLAQLFLGLARTGGRVQGSATFIPIRLSRQELADAVGTTVETCIRVMSRWSERRFVYASDAGFIVGDADRLELLAHATTPHPERAAHSPSTRPLPPGGYGWHTVTELDRRRHGRWDRFDVCPACWPVHTRVANELTRVQLNAPTSAGSRGRCHWCDTRRALAR